MADFCRHFKIQFHEPELLRLALTHRSYLSVTGKSARESNERLEFLGDSVLGLVTSEFLYRAHPNEHEGQLTKTKSLLVSKAILSRRALDMGLGRFVFMSHSEVESGGRQRLSILADAFEAVVGAIYLDLGFEPARHFIHHWLLSDAREIAADKRHTNYKSHLQEYVQSTFRTHPVYRIRSEMGPDHSKQFMVDVVVGRRVMGSGKGRNKKEAEQAAARDALEKANHRVTREAPPPVPAPIEREESRAMTADFEESDEPRRRRRGGRRRRSQGVGEESSGVGFEPEPLAPETSETAMDRVEETGPSDVVEEPVRERVVSRPERPARPRGWSEDLEEEGRPEGPLEELHIDPYGIEEAPPESGSGGGGFGRSVVGSTHSGAYRSFAPPAEEHERGEDAQTAEPDSAQEAQPGPAEPGSTGGAYGRRPGRSRRR